MATSRDRKAWTRILELYHKEFPYLWDRKHNMYSNKSVRNDAYEVLTEIYRDNFDADATVDILKKKLENLRTTYFRELRKVKKSMQLGDAPIYEPSLWYFKDLNFLANMYDGRGRYSTEPRATLTDPLKTEDNFDISNSDQEYEPSMSQENNSKRTENKRKHTVFKKQDLDQDITDQKPHTRSPEDWEVIGRSIGLQLRDISDKQLTIASKLISDTIYFAKLNRLSEESHLEIGTNANVSVLCDMCGTQVCD